jgi:membrane protease YdiL (CAAX protease family)
VSDEFWTETGRMAIAGGIVAAVVGPLALIAGAVIRRRKVPLFPARKPWRVPWGGFELTFAFVFVAIIPELFRAAGVQSLVAGLIAFPIQLSSLIVASRLLYPAWSPFRDPPIASANQDQQPHPPEFGLIFCHILTLGVLAWLLLTPFVHLINGSVTIAFTLLDLPVESHPLTQLAAGSATQHVLFMVEACVAAPIIEEILFRGILLPWTIGARERVTDGLQLESIAPPKGRPLVVMAAAALYAAGSGRTGPVLFAAVLTVGLAILWLSVRRGKRHARGIYASAALFSLVHSGVWPSPIPLFFLGVGLGWLAVRTRGVLVPALVHGLFNAVSAIYVLRGAA